MGAGESVLSACTFDVVIVDEATQATEPATLIPMLRCSPLDGARGPMSLLGRPPATPPGRATWEEAAEEQAAGAQGGETRGSGGEVPMSAGRPARMKRDEAAEIVRELASECDKVLCMCGRGAGRVPKGGEEWGGRLA